MKKILYLLILLVPLLMIAGERCVFSADVDKDAASPAVGEAPPGDDFSVATATPEDTERSPINANVQPGDVVFTGTFPAFTAGLKKDLI